MNKYNESFRESYLMGCNTAPYRGDEKFISALVEFDNNDMAALAVDNKLYMLKDISCTFKKELSYVIKNKMDLPHGNSFLDSVTSVVVQEYNSKAREKITKITYEDGYVMIF